MDTGPDSLQIRLYVTLHFTSSVILSRVFAKETNLGDISSSPLAERRPGIWTTGGPGVALEATSGAELSLALRVWKMNHNWGGGGGVQGGGWARQEKEDKRARGRERNHLTQSRSWAHFPPWFKGSLQLWRPGRTVHLRGTGEFFTWHHLIGPHWEYIAW